jgi:hypothetical protein
MFVFDNSIIGIFKYGIQISKLIVCMCFLGLVCKRYHIKKDTFPIYYDIFSTTLQNVFTILGVVSSYILSYDVENWVTPLKWKMVVSLFKRLSLWSLVLYHYGLNCHTVKTNGYDGKRLLLGLAFTWVYNTLILQSSLDLIVHNSGKAHIHNITTNLKLV